MVDQKKKILHVIRQGKIGGGETYVLQLIDNLNSKLFHNSVLSYSDGEMMEELGKRNVDKFVIDTDKPFYFLKYPQAIRLVKNINPDIIHAHGTRACSNILPVARFLRKPLIYTVHGWSFHPGNGLIQNIFRIISESLLVRLSSLTINVGNADKQLAKKKLWYDRSVVVQNGVDINKFSFKHEYKDIRALFGIPEGAIVVALIARMTKQKDPFTLIKAARLLIKSGHAFYFLFVGEGELKQDLMHYAHSEGIENNVKFSPFVRDVRPLLHAINIFCLPSLWEGLPIGLLEAVSMSKLSVVSDLSVHSDLQHMFPNHIAMFGVGKNSELKNALIDSGKKLKSPIPEPKWELLDFNQNVIRIEEIYNKILT